MMRIIKNFAGQLKAYFVLAFVGAILFFVPLKFHGKNVCTILYIVKNKETAMDNLTELANLKPAMLDAGTVFSGKSSGIKVRGYATASAYTPAIDKDFMFHDGCRDVIVWLLNPAEPLYVYGPVGCSKTTTIKQLAARLNYPVFEVTGHGRLEFADLAGHLTVQHGNMAYEYGPLALAMRYGGLLLFNEIDLTSPEVAAGLNSVLDGSPLCISENGGELIKPHPMFRFAATANTNGGGDDTGLFQGVQRQNAAFLDRFTLCEMGYPDADVETSLLAKRFPALPPGLCEKMVSYANEVRNLFMGTATTDAISNSIEITFSTRSLLRWGELALRYQPLARQGIQPITFALDRALAFRASRETRAMLHELARRVFPQEAMHNVSDTQAQETMSGQTAIDYVRQRLTSRSTAAVCLHLSMTHTLADNSISTKIWKAQSVNSGLRIQWGREGTSLQEKCFSKDECTQHNPVMELELRAVQKLREGYALNINKSTF